MDDVILNRRFATKHTPSSVAAVVVCSKAVFLFLFAYWSLLHPLHVRVSCLALFYDEDFTAFKFSNHLAEEERADA